MRHFWIAAMVTLVACSSPSPAPTRPLIQHVVIVVKENHSFDNYFGSLEDPQLSLPHCTSRVVQVGCQYNESDLSAYYTYARSFGYADRYFTDVRGPSWPNDMMMTAAQSPLDKDPPPPLSTWVCPTTCYDFPTIGDRLTGAGVSWRNYGEELYDPFRSIKRYADDRVHNVGVPQFFDDLATGRLPAVAWVRPSAPDSEHPGYDIERGQRWTVGVINAVMRSQFWASTAILLTWDDAGDVLDHVAPPVIERSPTGKAFRYGLRVALLAISPYTPSGVVSHALLSHVSLLKFIEDLHHIAPLNSRDGTANGLEQFFDFSMPPRAPLVLS